MERDPARRGLNLIVREGAAPSTAKISLDLHDVPMSEALRYITELAGMKYKVEPYAVLVVPVSDVATEQYTRTFKVPPEFLTMSADKKADASAAPADPFAAAGNSNRLPAKGSSSEILKGSGMTFPEGSSAVFVSGNNTLIVKNTGPTLDESRISWMNFGGSI